MTPLHLGHVLLQVRREYVFSEMLHHGEPMLRVRADNDMCLIDEVGFIVFIEHFPQCFLFGFFYVVAVINVELQKTTGSVG